MSLVVRGFPVIVKLSWTEKVFVNIEHNISERPLYFEQTVKSEDYDVESIIYSPYVPCDLWGRIMRASVKIQML